MRFDKAGPWQSAALFAVLAAVLAAAAARADDKVYVMKISTSTINDTPHLVSKNLGAAIERDSGGRIRAEIYPASQLGPIPRTIEGTQFGSIQAVVLPPEFFVGIDQRFEVLAAPALIGSMQQGQRVAADPAVRKLILGLGAQKGLHGAGLYIAQQQNVVSENADPSSRRFPRQEDPYPCIGFPVGGAQAAWRDAGGDDARRRAAGAPAGGHRRIDRRPHGDGQHALRRCRQIRDHDQSAGGLHHDRDQPLVVRLAAEGSAGDRRS